MSDSTPQSHKCGIYSIKCTINNRVYVGQSTDIQARWKQHKSGETNKALRRDMIRYGLNGFEFQIIELCEADYLNERENFWINWHADRVKLYNRIVPMKKARQQDPPSPFSGQIEQMESDVVYRYAHKWGNVHQFLDFSRFVVNNDEIPENIRFKTQELANQIDSFLSEWLTDNVR